MIMTVRRFEFGKDEQEWNNFLVKAKNQTFLFNRNFMDYHKDRFKDHSLMIYDEKEDLIACFPANEKNNTEIVSHSGLTYGAFIFEKKLKLSIIVHLFSKILKYYNTLGFEVLNYKSFPRIYNTIPSDEIDYCLFLADAKLWRRDAAIVIKQSDRIKYSGNIRREAKNAKKSGIIIEESSEFSKYWQELLVPNLQDRFGVKPVHNINEIGILVSNFPKFIKLYIAKSKENELLAGTVFFITETVAHCQYIAATDQGRKSGALNLLFLKLMDEILVEKEYFDLGIVNENDGMKMNHGMLAWKERMGGRSISHDFYEIDTSKYINFKNNLV